MSTSQYLVIFFQILGSLALLIYGMKVMSEALQKMAGSQLRHILGAMTTNRLTGMLTGTFIMTMLVLLLLMVKASIFLMDMLKLFQEIQLP